MIAASGTLATVSTLLQSTRRAEREQWLTPEELAARRERRMRELLARASGSRYYRSAIRAAGIDPATFTLDQLDRLPLVDRRVIAEHGEEAFLTMPREGLIDVMTSGSTVTGGTFAIDMKSIVCLDLTDAETNGKLVGHLKSDDFFGNKSSR